MAHAPSPCTDAPENAPAWPDLTLHDTTRRNAGRIQSALQPLTAHHPELHGRRCNDSLRRGMRKRMAATRRSDGEGRKLQDASLRDTAHRDAAFRRRRHVIKKAPWLITLHNIRIFSAGRARASPSRPSPKVCADKPPIRGRSGPPGRARHATKKSTLTVLNAHIPHLFCSGASSSISKENLRISPRPRLRARGRSFANPGELLGRGCEMAAGHCRVSDLNSSSSSSPCSGESASRHDSTACGSERHHTRPSCCVGRQRKYGKAAEAPTHSVHAESAATTAPRGR